MKIILVAFSKSLAEAWEKFFPDEKDVSIVEGDITQIECDAMVSPANSFGFMDGGLDYALSVRFGWDLQDRLQAIIKASPEGELLVGQALIIETNDAKTPLLISAPTMRVPTNFGIPTSINAYLAMKAILIQAKNSDKISSVAIPGLCTGTGGMDEMIAAGQMFKAYEEIILGKKQNFSTFGEAQKYHWNLNQKTLIWTH
jgi:O-acetyl-ADP-ribose deacetylase (regulator of RNase III)